MGTTESILYDDDYEVEVDDGQSVERQPKPKARSRPPPPSQVLLRGCVLGMSKSGKTSLLERFQGREPVPRGSRTDDAAETEEETIEIPYKAPADAPTWHDRIRLRVDASKKVHDESYDFLIVLVDPHKSVDKVHKYLTKTIRSAVKKRGTHDAPLCLCLLRSFRDVLSDKDTCIEPSDLTSWILECLGQLSIDSSRLVLQQLDVSLTRCYGLAQLHQFIYQAYAQHHMESLRIQLHQAREAQRKVWHPQPSYQEFCREALGESSTTTKHIQPSRRTIIQQKEPEPDLPMKSKEALEAFLESSDEDEEDEPPEDEQHETHSVETTPKVEEVEIRNEKSDESDNHNYTETSEQIQEDEPIPDKPIHDNDEEGSAATKDDLDTHQVESSQQTSEQSSKEEEGPPAAGEPTEDTSKPAIQDSFFESDNESSDGDVAVPSQATKDYSVDGADDDVEDGANDEVDDDDEFFISHINHDEGDDTDKNDQERSQIPQDDVTEASVSTIRESADVQPKDYNPEIKAALAAAKEDFERMLKEKETEEKKNTKVKKKKDPEKKKRKDLEKRKKKRSTTD